MATVPQAPVASRGLNQKKRLKVLEQPPSNCALDDDFLHVAGALVDLAHAHVAVDALHREVAHAVAAQGLDGG